MDEKDNEYEMKKNGSTNIWGSKNNHNLYCVNESFRRFDDSNRPNLVELDSMLLTLYKLFSNDIICYHSFIE